jgi:hypothetical protein
MPRWLDRVLPNLTIEPPIEQPASGPPPTPATQPV